MTVDEGLRTLGTRAGATQREIRQAYLDLVNVWHPDRFQGNSRLRQVAEERLREINQAYSLLKNSHPPPRSPRPETPPQDAAPPPPYPAADAQPRRTPPLWPGLRLPFWLVFRKLAYPVSILLVCLLPFWAGSRLVPLFRIPVLDVGRIQLHALDLQPRIVAPSRILDVSSGLSEAVDTLAEWARGDVIDLWKPLSQSASSRPAVVQPVVEERPAKSPAAKAKPRRAPVRASAGAPVAPENGTDLLAATASAGAGEIRLVNHTRFEIVIKLLRGGSTPLRAVYVKPGSSATMRAIAIGIYHLRIEAGTGLDASGLRFQTPAAPYSAGPFEFFEITSASGTTGQHYTVVLSPESATGLSGNTF
jgi:hypothetical protein